jgi:hypothetical protein
MNNLEKTVRNALRIKQLETVNWSFFTPYEFAQIFSICTGAELTDTSWKVLTDMTEPIYLVYCTKPWDIDSCRATVHTLSKVIRFIAIDGEKTEVTVWQKKSKPI